MAAGLEATGNKHYFGSSPNISKFEIVVGKKVKRLHVKLRHVRDVY